MTFVGKILVILIMALSLIFLGISTVVFTTSQNWLVAANAQKKAAGELKTKLDDANAKVAAAEKDLEAEKVKYEALTKQQDNQIKALEAENARQQQEITRAGNEVAGAEATAKTALAEAEARRNEAIQLREKRAAVEDQANKFKLKQAELFDRIRELERIMETANKNNADLKDRVARYSTLLRQNGLSEDITRVKGTEAAPPVVGKIKQVDPANRNLVISIGSDDGLSVGNELYLFRQDPRPEYLGKMSVTIVDPDQAVGRVIGGTYQGKKLREGDIVSSTINPRG
ncbi:hypothetical protein OJF2_68090 [Aquisphaera giovannonii]|uniref:Chromosome partition protein Smc n=1 Tax=Aquisphaera giovannonii TaxID=406548 RepID=A0A5B9WE15_9BACT|nr:hypothetical protein [Aquisphaera giovannonii]QEH38211.1 hypothetical protein OJF2_68090 [Aquisphaera giovannonii]